jgi:hypothetical protein
VKRRPARSRAKTPRRSRAVGGIVVSGPIANPGTACCSGGVCDPRRIQTVKAPAPVGSHTLVDLKGPGVFVAGQVSKLGGTGGLTFVRLVIDGQSLLNMTFAFADSNAFTGQNPSGITLTTSGARQNFMFGWPVPLVFRRSLTISASVNEKNVAQLVGSAVVGSVRC